METTRGDQYKGTIQVGQRVHCILYGGNDGIVSRINGEQSPESVKRMGGGAVVMGGRASFDIVFDDHVSRSLPECILRGVQWFISDEIATTDEIISLMAEADMVQAEKKSQEKKEAEERAEERQILPAKYPYLITVKDSGKSYHAIGAKNLKNHLSREFPGVKFSVKSSSYSGGDSIYVYWTDGPTTEQVKAISDRYQEGSFDGMNDIYEYNHGNVWPDVFGGAKYVMENRHESRELIIQAAKELGFSITADDFDQWGNLKEGGKLTSDHANTGDVQMIYREARKTSCCEPKPKAELRPQAGRKLTALETILAD